MKSYRFITFARHYVQKFITEYIKSSRHIVISSSLQDSLNRLNRIEEYLIIQGKPSSNDDIISELHRRGQKTHLNNSDDELNFRDVLSKHSLNEPVIVGRKRTIFLEDYIQDTRLSPFDFTMNQERSRRLENKISELSPKEIEALKLMYGFDLLDTRTSKEAAEILQLTPAAVNLRANNAFRTLKKDQLLRELYFG